MNCKVLTIIVTFIFASIFSCSSVRRIIYSPNINQGNYFTYKDLSNVSIGMTQQQVNYVLGAPIMTDPFDSNIWFYIFRKYIDYDKKIIWQILTLIFNKNGVLINIDSKFN